MWTINKEVFNRCVSNTESCLYYILPEKRDLDIVNKIRNSGQYQISQSSTVKFSKSPIPYCLLNYQWLMLFIFHRTAIYLLCNLAKLLPYKWNLTIWASKQYFVVSILVILIWCIRVDFKLKHITLHYITLCWFQIENVSLEVPFPKSVLNVTLTASQGKYSFDPVTKVMTWDIGKIDSTKLPNIRGNVSTIYFLL